MAASRGGDMATSVRTFLAVVFGLSSGLIGVYAGATIVVIGGMFVGGLGVGALLVWIALPGGSGDSRADRYEWD
jgi:tetrahydromethanopterin S-methyltransferase subunit C